MKVIATTRLSSKGQVVIPEPIRRQLNLRAGMHFVVLGEEDVIILKSIPEPNVETFEHLLQKARQQAKEVGLKRSDITKAISKARGRE